MTTGAAQPRELQVSYEGKTYKLSAQLRPSPDSLIIFLHGWGGSKESFAEAFTSDALKSYGICTIDLLGFGASDKPQDFSYDLLDQARIVAQAINSLNAHGVYVVGHSMGGGIGLLAASDIKNLQVFISAEGNLAVNGNASREAQIAAAQSFRAFSTFTLPTIIALLRLHPRRRMRPWAQWYGQASPVALHRSVKSLVAWSASGKLLPLFESLPRKAYIYSANGKRRNDVVPKLDKTLTYEVPASGHALMTDNPRDFYATVARIIQGQQGVATRPLAAAFIERLQKNGIDPILYGSLGASLYLGDFKTFGDIDLLVPPEWLRGDWERLQKIMTDMGFTLVDAHEHEFKNSSDISVAFADETVLTRDGILSSLDEAVTTTIGTALVRTLTAQQFKKAYAFSAKDGYRKDSRGKKDTEIITLLDAYVVIHPE